ncbi:terpene cyclase/mutase family protein [Candidatus Woesearchaeota archaeon]|nr:terpene cyclase/mutase family protein [Candidatus Woesearchaeota archaeon]
MIKKRLILMVFFAFLLASLSVNAIIYDMHPEVSFRFLQSSQNIEDNKFNDLQDIYFYLSIYNQAEKMNEIDNKTFFIETIQNFQNPDGGFGDWLNDRSKAGSTRLALMSLEILDASPVNKTSLKNFLYELQVLNLTYGNYGFKSSLKDTDADLSSTYDVIYSLNILNFDIPNKQGVIAYLKDHQNFDGGFGLQTNRKSDIFWTSTLTHTRRGLEALDIIGESPDFMDKSISFIHSLQSVDGGYSNEKGSSPKVTSTYNAISSLQILGQKPNNVGGIENFIKNNQEQNGGFVEYSLDNKEGIHTAFYAMSALNKINKRYDGGKIIGFLESFLNNRLDGGFPNYPGLESTLKSTFNSVSSLNLIGKKPLNSTLTINFVEGFKNSDGGYGQNSESNVESTYRSILALNVLGATITEKDKTIQYLKDMQNNDGGFGFGENLVSRVSYTYRAIRALYLLGSKPQNVDGAISFLKSAQNIDGGFSNNIGDKTSALGSTYRAIRALHLLGSVPKDKVKAKDFIMGCKNSDGGFKISPMSLVSPQNLSKSVYAYDAVIALHILGYPLNDDLDSLNFIKELRNPDLGFATAVDFTSDASSTFTSLWTYYYLASSLNAKPELKFSKVEHFLDESDTSYFFSTRFYDNDSIFPEYAHLILGGERHLLSFVDDNLKGEKYVVDLSISLGDYNYYFEASDGIEIYKSEPKTFSVTEKGEIPLIIVESDYKEGTPDTIFDFRAVIKNIDLNSIRSVHIKFNDRAWHSMNETQNYYTYQKRFNPGEYTYQVKVYDGLNVVSSKQNLIKVYGLDNSKPEWDLFLKIKNLVYSKYNTTISYNYVSKEILDGNLYWGVSLSDKIVYVDYIGENFYGEKPNNSLMPYLLISIAILIIGITFFIYKKRQK